MEYTPLAPEGYIPRVVDERIERYLSAFGAVEVSGTKWSGKTWTSLAHGNSVTYVDEALAVAEEDPHAVTVGDRPHVIDEWQLVPAIWDAVRREADRERGLRGGWILTGSSTPFAPGSPSAPVHSGAGRIGRVRMRPMSLAESGDSTCQVSLAGLLEGRFEPVLLDEDFARARPLVELACRGGWPEAIGLDPEGAQLVAAEYMRGLVEHAALRHNRGQDPMRRLLVSVARTLGQSATQATLYADMYGEPAGGLDSARRALVSEHLRLLAASYVLEELPGWVPAARSPKRLSVKPKRYLADPSLAVAALGMGIDSLLLDWQTFGTVFENLCVRDLLVYASALPGAGPEPLRYYRDDAGLEVDAIIELADGRWAAIEVKTSDEKVPEAVASLARLRRKLCANERARTREPEFMAVVVGMSRYARRTPEGVYVVPLRALCP